MAVDIEPLTPSVPASVGLFVGLVVPHYLFYGYHQEAGAQASRIRRPTKPNRAFVEVPPRNLRERGARWVRGLFGFPLYFFHLSPPRRKSFLNMNIDKRCTVRTTRIIPGCTTFPGIVGRRVGTGSIPKSVNR